MCEHPFSGRESTCQHCGLVVVSRQQPGWWPQYSGGSLTFKDTPDGGLVVAVCMAGLAAVLTLLGLYVFPWGPKGFEDRYFLQIADALQFSEFFELGQDGGWGWWVVPDTYFLFGFLVHTAGVLVAPFVICREDRWHGLASVAMLGAAWQLLAVQETRPADVTVAPYLGAVAGLMLVGAWFLARLSVPR